MALSMKLPDVEARFQTDSLGLGGALQHCHRLPNYLADDDTVRFDGDLSRLGPTL